jgi:hypothetical protein
MASHLAGLPITTDFNLLLPRKGFAVKRIFTFAHFEEYSCIIKGHSDDKV